MLRHCARSRRLSRMANNMHDSPTAELMEAEPGPKRGNRRLAVVAILMFVVLPLGAWLWIRDRLAVHEFLERVHADFRIQSSVPAWLERLVHHDHVFFLG